jgi:hypothetical protein
VSVKLSSDKTVAVDQAYYWRPMQTCPVSAKVQLLGRGGVAVYGAWDGKSDWWRGWAPLPKVPNDWKENE